MTQCLVICLDDNGDYRICTRQLMTVPEAEEYAMSIDPARRPIIVRANRNWVLRPIAEYSLDYPQ